MSSNILYGEKPVNPGKLSFLCKLLLSAGIRVADVKGCLRAVIGSGSLATSWIEERSIPGRVPLGGPSFNEWGRIHDLELEITE
jgi:hypothetical protein